MILRQYEDVSQFYARSSYYLLRHEAIHSVMLGICDSLTQNPQKYDYVPYLATVEADEIIAVAMCTRARPLLLSQCQNLAAMNLIAENLIEYLYSHQQLLPGVNAPIAESQAFASSWASLTGQSYQLKMAIRAFQLEKVQQPSQPPGYLRVATEKDKELLMQWVVAFSDEAVGAPADAESWVNNFLLNQTAFVWEDEVPVSLACRTRVTPNGVGISVVYTPSEYRRKGYGSACVAALSEHFLNQGYKYCFLFTDLANPTSNHIYQAIGYQPAGDCYEYLFM